MKALIKRLGELQHLMLLLLTSYLIITSGWIMIGRSLRDSASFWDISHVYLGLVTSVLATSFFIRNVIKGKWRQYFSWIIFDITQIKQDLIGLTRKRIPVAGGKGLFSLIEGLGLLLLLGTAITGVIWFVVQGDASALTWRSHHQLFAKGFIGFILIHVIFACLHLLDFIRD